ncbi:MAG: UPF0262 family protein [Alphaproteobacteria bacterium]|nr:UPF0262 family protein [Alphaproteobacteria bacterium]
MSEISAETSPFRIAEVVLDEEDFVAANPQIEHERKVAAFDLIEENSFRPMNSQGGPYRLRLALEENRLVFDIKNETGSEQGRIMLSLTPFRRVIKDYFMVCESYHQAIRTATPSQIEAIDMGRRGLHNEASQILKERLDGKIDMDFDTARRLFTLICALHFKG